MTDSTRSPAPKSSALDKVSLILSTLSLCVSGVAAFFTFRASESAQRSAQTAELSTRAAERSADAGEQAAKAADRSAKAAEEQVRPHLDFSSPLALRTDKTITVSAELENSGNAHAIITRAEVSIEPPEGPIFRQDLPNIATKYAMIGSKLHVELTIGRPIVQNGEDVDYGKKHVKKLCFFVNYNLKGNDERQYSEPAVCWDPTWVDEKKTLENHGRVPR